MSTYLFLARIHPETVSVRLDVRYPPLTLNIGGTEALSCVLRLLLAGSDIVLHVTTSEPIQDVETLRNQVQTITSSIFDGVCYYTGQVVTVEITSVLTEQPLWLTAFEAKSPAIGREAAETALPQEIFFNLAVSSVHLRSALADLREAVATPNDTGFFAYRAVETIMQSFKQPGEETSKDAWDRLHTALQISEVYLRPMTVHATANRHGVLTPISGGQREDLIVKTRTVIHRFAAYLSGGQCPLNPTQFANLT